MTSLLAVVSVKGQVVVVRVHGRGKMGTTAPVTAWLKASLATSHACFSTELCRNCHATKRQWLAAAPAGYEHFCEPHRPLDV